jgi:dihydroneopterin aldolase
MADAVILRGLRALGVHGVLSEEHESPQPFEVDVELSVDLRRAGQSDDLADTVDYGTLADSVLAIVGGETCALIEKLAERIASAALALPGVESVTVEVRKLQPPLAAELDHAAVRITRP